MKKKYDSRNWILDDKGKPKQVDLLEWGKWMQNSGEKRRVGYDKLKKVYVSTVFLGIDYDFMCSGKPILWETMVFENKVSTHKLFGRKVKYHEEYHGTPEKPFPGQTRFRSQEEAEEFHKKLVRKLKRAGL